MGRVALLNAKRIVLTPFAFAGGVMSKMAIHPVVFEKMSATVLERVSPEIPVEENHPFVLVVPEMYEDGFAVARAEEIRKGIGATAVRRIVQGHEVGESSASKHPTLMHAIHHAAEGDETARQVVYRNVMTEAHESLFKAGTFLRAEFEVDEHGQLSQHGQTLEDIIKNTFLYAADDPYMYERAVAEAHNAFRMQELYKGGWLNDYYLFVASEVPESISKEHAKELGFFTDTLSCAIQIMTVENGVPVQETVFVAGVQEPDGERHDHRAIEAIAAHLGVSYAGKNTTEVIDTPLLVPKSLVDGPAGFARLYDEAVGGGVFFGQRKPQQDYAEYRQYCFAREAALQPTAQAVTEELVAESEKITTPVQAIAWLHEVTKRRIVEYAVLDNHDIEAAVFGPGAQYIDQARQFLAEGNYHRFVEAYGRAQETAVTSSCPYARQAEAASSGRRSGQEKDEESSEGVGDIHRGVCIIKGCRTRPGETWVGGCGICLGVCQGMFDIGLDPQKIFEAQARLEDAKSSNSQGNRERQDKPIGYIWDTGRMAVRRSLALAA